jgi:hypothetical protein
MDMTLYIEHLFNTKSIIINIKTVRNNEAKVMLTHNHQTSIFTLPMQAIYNHDAQELLNRAGEVFDTLAPEASEGIARRLYQEIHASPIIQAQKELDRLRSLACA